ncbi:ABC transporter ATP-binding protein [Salinispira pacifica]
MLELRSCSAAYQDNVVFSDISFSVPAGSTLAVVGRSGCGKSTLLAVAAGLKRPAGGRVELNGSAILPGAAALIPQQYGLFPWFTALGNVELGLRVRRIPRAERRARAAQTLARVHLEGLAHRYPAALSGGQQQRVAIARAIVLQPRALLMDEPFSALDALTRERLQDLLIEVLEGGEIPSIIVTHSIEEAAYLGNRIAVMAGRPAKLHMVDNPGRGSAGYRLDSRYFETCRAVRGLLESGGAA